LGSGITVIASFVPPLHVVVAPKLLVRHLSCLP
jgi:hypothetical protein